MIWLAVIVVFIVDLSGFPESIKGALSDWIGKKVIRLRPIDCSLCMVWWSEIVYLLATGRFTLLNIMYAGLLAFSADIIAGLMRLAKDMIIRLMNKL